MGSRESFRSSGFLVAAIIILSVAVAGCSGSSSQRSDTTPPGGGPTNPPPGGSNPPPGSGSSPAPSITLSANPATVDEGGMTTLTWSAAEADSCTASGGWSGSLNTSGSMNIGPLVAGTTFSLSCEGPGGNALQMISISVVGPVQLSWMAPTENVDGSQLTDLGGYRIYYGEASRSYSSMVELTDASATSHTLSLATGDYYVAMTAVDADGNESAYSNEVIKTRL